MQRNYQKLKTKNSEIRFFSYGDDSSQSIFYVHSNPGSAEDLHEENLKNLAEDFRVVIFDRPGHGESTSELFGFEATEEVVLALREKLSCTQFILMGHGWGAAFALWYANRHPEHLQSIYLVNPIAYPREEEEDPAAGLKMLNFPGMFKLLRSKIESQMKSYFQKCFNQELPENFLNSRELSKAQVIATLKDRADLQIQLETLAKAYSKIETRCHILATKDDKIAHMETQAERLYQSLPNASLISEPHGGHALPYIESLSLVQNAQLLKTNTAWAANL